MFRMNKLTDYGVVLLTRFAQHPEHAASARELAEETHLPLPTVGKVLKLLVRDGILVSHRGTKGGYALAREPREVTVASIISALEGPVSLTECQAPGVCGMERGCPTKANWQVVNRAILEALSKLTLLDMTRPLAPSGFPFSRPALPAAAPRPTHRSPVP